MSVLGSGFWIPECVKVAHFDFGGPDCRFRPAACRFPGVGNLVYLARDRILALSEVVGYDGKPLPKLAETLIPTIDAL